MIRSNGLCLTFPVMLSFPLRVSLSPFRWSPRTLSAPAAGLPSLRFNSNDRRYEIIYSFMRLKIIDARFLRRGGLLERMSARCCEFSSDLGAAERRSRFFVKPRPRFLINPLFISRGQRLRRSPPTVLILLSWEVCDRGDKKEIL